MLHNMLSINTIAFYCMAIALGFTHFYFYFYFSISDFLYLSFLLFSLVLKNIYNLILLPQAHPAGILNEAVVWNLNASSALFCILCIFSMLPCMLSNI